MEDPHDVVNSALEVTSGMKYLLAHDIGTTGDKACLFDENGALVCRRYSPYKTWYLGTNYAEQNPDDWWAAFCESTRHVLKEAGAKPEEIAAIGICGHNPSTVPVDETGALLTQLVPIHADLRASEEVQYVLSRIGGAEAFYRITGAGQIPEHYSVFKMVWLINHLRDGRRIARFLNTVDYVVFRLTGQFSTDYSQASNLGLLDITTREWSSALLEAAGLTKEMLPPIHRSTDVVGYVHSSAAPQAGVVQGTPVVAGGADVSCAAVGAGAIREGVLYINLGSAAWVGTYSERPCLDPVTKITNFCHIVPSVYAVHHFMTGAGICYQWLRDTLFSPRERRCPGEGRSSAGADPYELMNAEAGQVEPGSGGLIFLPYMRGIAFGTPSPKARGALIGLSLSHSAKHILRACVEGIAFAVRELIDDFERLGFRSQEVRVVGGGARSQFWRQTLADICGKTIICPSLTQEAGAFGAALAAGIGVGVFDDFGRALDLMAGSEVHQPRQELQDFYAGQYDTFKAARDALKPTFDSLHLGQTAEPPR